MNWPRSVWVVVAGACLSAVSWPMMNSYCFAHDYEWQKWPPAYGFWCESPVFWVFFIGYFLGPLAMVGGLTVSLVKWIKARQ